MLLAPYVFAVTVLAASPAPAPLSHVIAVHGLAVGIDAASTEWALARNPRAFEGNPLLRDRGLRLAVKAGEAALLVALDRGMERRYGKGAARAFRWVVVGLHVLVAAWNVRQGQR